MGKNVKTYVMQKIPKIFALTSDIDEEKAKQYKLVGFNNVCK